MFKIGTHNGAFHADEALACFMLKLIPKYKDASIVRTRDAEVLKDLDIVVDVGGEYIPEKLRFDHHQRSFNETFSPNFATKLSSAGLVFKHFGQEIISNYIGEPVTSSRVEYAFKTMYQEIIEEFDAVDNGIMPYDENILPKFKYGATSAFSRVGRLKFKCFDEGIDEDVVFGEAMEITGECFLSVLNQIWKRWIPDRESLQLAISKISEVHDSKQIIELALWCDWKPNIHALQEELNIEKPILYVINQDPKTKYWKCTAVHKDKSPFVSLLPFPEPWRGLRDEDLSKVSGIPDCVFTHASGFLSINKTREGILKMAISSLQQQSEELDQKRCFDMIS